MRAVVWTGALEVRDDVEVRAPGPGEVKVRIHRAGLCHSDVSIVNGTMAVVPPLVLGHEGAGVVEEVGAGVRHTQPGDHVVLATLGFCGMCDVCERGRPTHCSRRTGVPVERFTSRGRAMPAFGDLGVFAEWTVVSESQVVVIDRRVPFSAAAVMGCAVITGAGAVLNRAKVHLGATVVVIGSGGIGLSAVQAARVAGAERIVVLDANPAKEGIARRFGATDFIDASSTPDTVEVVRGLIPGGVDYAFECVGRPELIRDGFAMLGTGGCCVVVGSSPRGSALSIPVSGFDVDRSIIGCRVGGARPAHDIPLYCQLYLDGRFLLDELVTATYDLADIEVAMADLQDGKLNRGQFVLA